MLLNSQWITEEIKEEIKKYPEANDNENTTTRASLMAQMVKICLRCGRLGFDLWVRKIPWRREWQPTPVFLPGEFHGQRSLVGYSPWGCKESDTTELLSTHCIFHYNVNTFFT